MSKVKITIVRSTIINGKRVDIKADDKGKLKTQVVSVDKSVADYLVGAGKAVKGG